MLFSYQVTSDSLWLHRLQYARPPCSSPPPRVSPSSCPLNWWCHPIISFSDTLFSFCLHSIFPSIGVFSDESAVHIRWPKYWSFSFSISPSNEYSGLTFFSIDWFDLLEVQGTLNTTVQSINSAALCLLYGPALTSIHAYWKDHSLDYTDLCWQSDVFAL